MPPGPRSDIPPDLIHACARSAAAPAWERFLAECGPRLRAEVRAALHRAGTFPTRDLAEDLEQEVLCRLLERDRRVLASFRGATAAEAGQYLRRVVNSVVVDALRAAAAAKRSPVHEPVSVEELEGEDERFLEDRRGCPEARLLAREDGRALLARCAEALGTRAQPDRRRAVALALVGGLSSDEIAARLGGAWTRGAVDALLHRVRDRLARRGVPLPVRRPSASG